MAERFWDMLNGDDLNSGSMAYPWRSYVGAAPAAWLLAASIGDIGRAAGTLRPTLASLNALIYPTLTGLNEFTLEQWDGRDQHVIRADAPLVAITWTNVSGDVWTATLPTGLGFPSAMTVAYDSSTWTGQNARSMNYGVCLPQANDAAVDATRFSFRYVSATGACRLNCPGHNPNVSPVTMVRHGNTGTGGIVASLVNVVSGIAVTVRGIQFRLNAINTGGENYGIYFNSCANCLAEENEMWDQGPHGVTFAGTLNSGNTSRRNKVYSTAIDATNFVTYCAHATNNVENCLFEDDEGHVLPSRDGDGNDVAATTTQQAFYGHCGVSPSNSVIASCTLRRCFAYVYSPRVSGSEDPDASGGRNRNGFGASDVAAYAGAWYETAARPMLWDQCQSYGDVGMGINHAGHFRRCIFRFSNHGPSNAPGASTGALQLVSNGSTVRVNPLFEACDIIANLQASTGTPTERMINCSNSFAFTEGEGIGMLGCNLLNTGGGTNSCLMIDWTDETGFYWHAYGCIIGHTARANSTTYMCGTDGSVDAAHHDLKGNIYLNPNQGLFEMSVNASFDSWAEFAANIDTAGGKRIVGASAAAATATLGFRDLTRDGSMRSNSAARGSLSLTRTYDRSINGKRFRGDYGPRVIGARPRVPLL